MKEASVLASSLHSCLIHNYKLARHATYARRTTSRTATVTCNLATLLLTCDNNKTSAEATPSRTNATNTPLTDRSTNNLHLPPLPASTRGSRWPIAQGLTAHACSSTSSSASARSPPAAASLSSPSPTSRGTCARNQRRKRPKANVAQANRTFKCHPRSLDLSPGHIPSPHSTRLDSANGHRGDRCFYGSLISILVSFLCFSIYTGHSGDNPNHDFSSKPKKSKGQDK